MKQQKKMLLGLLFIVAALAIALAALTALNESNTSASEAEASANDVTLFSASEAVKLCYQYGEEVSLEKDTDGNWRLSGDDTTDLDQTIVDSMITAVCFFSPEQRIVNVTDLAQYGLAEPAVSIAVTTADGATYTVRMGDVNASTDDLYLALEDSLDTVYTVSKQKLAAFQYTAADLLKPATPETAEDATSGTEIGSGTENSIETAETATAETAAVEPVSGATTTE